MGKFPDWIYRQSAVLPFRRRDGELEVLLITSRNGKRWVLPKGIVEPGMTAPDSAAKEAEEEAGVEGMVWETSLGRYAQKKWGGTCKIEVFPMRVTAEKASWPEADTRRREWLPLEAAAQRVESTKLRKLLGRLPQAIDRDAEGRPPKRAETRRRARLIHILRHAKSSWDDPTLDDFDRPLAERGRRAGAALSEYLRLGDIEPDLVLCSSAARAKQTLEQIRPALGAQVTVKLDKRLYGAGPRALLSRLRSLPDTITSVMLIGHNPALQSLALALTGSGDADALARLGAKFPTGGLVTLVLQTERWRDLGPADCELHSFVAPRELP